MISFGNVPAGSILPIMFTSYAGATGASVTLTGLAVTDIEVYKGTSMTQRASDNGYALLDTDGIDIDSITGLHGFSIDLGDNSDSGFYTAGSFYTVVVSAVTIDSQTVNFIAATFRIVAAESSAGTPKVDVSHVSGTAQTAGDLAAAIATVSAKTTNLPSDPADASDIAGAFSTVNSTLSTIAAYIDTEVAAIKAKTDNLPANPAAVSDIPTALQNADALLNRDMSAVSDTNSRTPLNALRFLRNKWSLSGTTLTVTEEDDSTTAWTATVTTNAAADPITGSDPA